MMNKPDMWESEEFRLKFSRIPRPLQGKFLANIQELYHQESESMLDFIRRSRNSLRDTASEIKDEQEVLQETFRKLSQDRAKSRLDVGHNPAPRRERSNVSTRSYPPHAQTHKPYCPSPEPAISYPGYSRPTDPRYPPATDPRHPVHADPRYPPATDPRHPVHADPRFPAQDPRYPVLADPRFPPVINPGYPKSASRLPPLAKTTMHYENEEFNDADDDEYFKEETEEIMRATSRAHDVHELERARQKERVEKLKEQRKQKQEERAEVAQELIREASNLEKQKDEQKKRQEEKLKERIREMKKHKSMTGLGGDRSLSSLGGDLSVTGLGGDLARSASRGTLPDVDVDTDIVRTPRPRSPATLDTSPADDNIVINHLPGADTEPEPTETETEDPKERKRREKKERKEKKEKDKKEKKEKKRKSREKELEEIAM